MAVGQGALVSFNSYLAIAREITYGTYVTGTAGMHFKSASMKTLQEVKILESVENSRTFGHHIQMGRVVEGEIEFYFGAKNQANTWLLQNGFGGGPVSTATATGETVGGGAFTHTISLNNFYATYSSLSFNHRKGDSSGAKIFEYKGIRVNEFSLSAEIDDALVAKVGVVAQDSSLTTNDVASTINSISQTPLSFVNGRFSVEGTFASLTSTSFWHVQSINFGINNNLKSDENSRRLGTDILQVLPPGIANLELSCKIRFDTSTAYSAMLLNSTLSAEFEFLGPTMSGSAIRESLKIQFPKVFVTDAGDPEIGGPDEVLISEVKFAVLRDISSAPGYAVRAVLTNNIASYA